MIDWRICAGISIAFMLFGFAIGCGYKNGEIARLKQDYAEQVSKALDENRQLEKKMQADADAITVKYNKEKKDAEKTISNLRSRIASGDLRLSFRTASTKGMPDSTSTEYREERAELDQQTAQSLVSIASDGDDAIRDLNQCIDKYEAVRRKE